MDINTAAERLGLHYQTVRNMILDGRLKAEKVSGAWDVSDDHIHEMLEFNIRKMDKYFDFHTGIKVLKNYHNTCTKESIQNVINACAELTRAAEQSEPMFLFHEKLKRIESSIAEYNSILAAKKFFDKAEQDANRNLKEADVALSVKANMVKKSKKDMNKDFNKTFEKDEV